jgi:hypothetical protein
MIMRDFGDLQDNFARRRNLVEGQNFHGYSLGEVWDGLKIGAAIYTIVVKSQKGHLHKFKE